MLRSGLFALLALGSAPCTGQVVDLGSNRGADGGPLACPATLPLQAVTTLTDAAAAVSGRWEVCQGLQNLVPTWAQSDVIGMEFTPATSGGDSCAGWTVPCVSGYIYFLVAGPSGPVRAQAYGYQVYYSIIAETSGTGAPRVQLTLLRHPTDGTWGTQISVLANPRMLALDTIGYNDGALLVGVP